jgi:hypothetical protein
MHKDGKDSDSRADANGEKRHAERRSGQERRGSLRWDPRHAERRHGSDRRR